MALETQASDWEFAGICQIGGAAGIGGGGYMFMFRSETAGERQDVYFFGGGIGMGGSAGGASAPQISTGEIPYSPIDCINPFSMRDLHNSVGSIVSGGVSTIVGWNYTLIAATSSSTVYFERQGGWGGNIGGFGVGGTAFVGIWKVGRIMAASSLDEERAMMREVRGSRRS
jgi:hypothetical protein